MDLIILGKHSLNIICLTILIFLSFRPLKIPRLFLSYPSMVRVNTKHGPIIKLAN
jgi:hypothetical protein